MLDQKANPRGAGAACEADRGAVRRLGFESSILWKRRCTWHRRFAPKRSVLSSVSPMPKADLLTPIRQVKNLHPQFLNLISHDIYEPARGMLREVYAEFPDPDGNFVEQFQTSGFDARTFELFLFAMFKDLGHHIEREPRLDFILSRDGQQACVEAVIASPPPNDGI